ncbi:hypothetical protein A9X06_04925 [Mycobacterium sp. 852002-51759_SCH5129042]|nr:hypothetical protein A9X06_04925 [Mycobacterium sp. 852002-51759_SCH5129042]
MSGDQISLFGLPRHPVPLHRDDRAEWSVVWSYGMGVESTAGLVLTLTEPRFGPSALRDDLSNLIVITAQTGDEWHSTCDLVARHVLPLLRQFNVRTVEVARAGPRREDGIVVLQDTRRPRRMHPDPVEWGFYALSDENRSNGVMPTLSSRRCSEKAKGWPMDTWRASELGDRPYVHAIGYNLDEQSRVDRDRAITLGGQRHPIYPLHAHGWSRQHCSDYLYKLFGVRWPKSCCRQCCFVSKRGWPDQLERYRGAPRESYRHVVDEYTTLALNPSTPLFGRAGSLTDRLAAAGTADAVLRLADEYMNGVEWALYRVRRIYWARGTAWRSLDIVARGTRTTMQRLLTDLAAHLRLSAAHDGPHSRLWLTPRPTTDHWPRVEEVFVPAPAEPAPKQRGRFDIHWAAHVPDDVRELDWTATEYLAA